MKIAAARRRSTPRHKQPASTCSGFTLVEIMLVIGIIVVLMGVSIKLLVGNKEYAEDVAAEAGLDQIMIQLKTYETFNLRMPTTSQGLKALVEKPTTPPVPQRWKQLLSKEMVDPWGNPYQYRNPGKKNPKGIDVFSLGRDRVESEDDVYAVGK